MNLAVWQFFTGLASTAVAMLEELRAFALDSERIAEAAEPRRPVVIGGLANSGSEVLPLLDHEVGQFLKFLRRPFLACVVNRQVPVVALANLESSERSIGAISERRGDISGKADQSVVSLNLSARRQPIRVAVNAFHAVLIVACLAMAACGKKPPVIQPQIVEIVKTVEVSVPVPYKVPLPPEILAAFRQFTFPTFVDPSHPEASSALTAEQERVLRAFIETVYAIRDALIAHEQAK